MSPGTFFICQVDPSRYELHAAPGQFLLVTSPTLDPYLPRVAWPFHLRGDLVESVLLPPDAAAWSHSDQLDLRGPFGRPFTVPGRPLHTLVLTEDALASAQMLILIEALVGRGCEVTVLCSPDRWTEHWLPPEVEYRGVENIGATAADLAWADRLYACGSSGFYDPLLEQVRGTRLVMDQGWGEILLRDLPMPCGVGACYLCACKTRHGVILTCKAGPVLDLADWQREE